MSDRVENDKQQRRPLTREEREAMKRELKRQMRAYVDALKAQMLGAKEKGEKPDLEEALSRAAEEAEKKMVEEAAQGDPMVKQAAALQAAARAREAQRDVIDVAHQQGQPRHDGMIPKFADIPPPAEKPQAQDGAAAAQEAAQEKAQESPREKAQEQAPADPDNIAAQVAEAAKHSALPKEELERLTRDIIAALKTVYDPEIPVDIYELGLIYRIDIADDRTVAIDMTLTAPGCPVAGEMPGWVQKAVGEVEGVKAVKVNLVFDPPWDMSRMSDEARLALNMF